MGYQIITFRPSYKDDMIQCFLLAKKALGRKAEIKEDLLNIQAHYFDRNDMFWIAIDGANRVIGMLGTHTVSNTDMWLKRLFIRPSAKRSGLGSALYLKAEEFAGHKGIKTIHTRFSSDFKDAAKFYPAMGFYYEQPSDGFNHLTKDICR